MTSRLLTLLLLAACVTPAGATDDLPARARAVLADKCASCHGPDLPRPKGKFGYVTDLARLAGNPKLVVPPKPEESHLWDLIEGGDMPPPDSPVGALTAAEKGAIRDWIAAGAPAEESVAPAPAAAQEAPPPPSFGSRLLRWLGKCHVLVIHFPIALLTAAAVAEAWCCWRRRRRPWAPVRFCVLLGAAGAVAAAALGWLLADVGGFGRSEPRLLGAHRWLGVAAAAWALGTVALSEIDARRGRRGWPCRLALWSGAALVGAAAHLGGALVHGEDFLAW